MQGKEQNLIIIGAGEFAEIACEYFTYDSPYSVVAFSIEHEYITTNEINGLPVIPFEDLEKTYSPSEYSVFVAMTYTQLNRLRERFYNNLKEKGYQIASYISSNAFVWRNVEIGENWAL
ncbi:hypothetical protein [Methanolacinia petrolearia]|uniref:PglD-related sugar-binding protein n=1 Tax=Methanolacinia petrolearia TaxID=54120 RepID=UPI003BADA67B